MPAKNDKPAAPTPTPATDSAKHDWSASIKWLVIGGLLLVFMLLFKAEIGGMLGRTEGIDVKPDGSFSLKLRTVSTPLGNTVLSSQGAPLTVAAAPAAVPGVSTQPNASAPDAVRTFNDPQGRFSIAWPGNGKWQQDAEFAQQFGAALMVRHVQPAENFMPNVNVVVTEDMGLDIDAYLAAGNAVLTNSGWQVQSLQTDPATKSAVQVVVNQAGNLFQIQRVVLHKGLAFVVTASRASSDNRPELYRNMGEILNSFRVL